jgi:SAM-dependent methyltransferase
MSIATLPGENNLWQLQMFRQSLKKQLKLTALLQLMGKVDGQKCLLVTCGDNNGALNWYFRAAGGDWKWSDLSEENLSEMSDFLAEPVTLGHDNRLPFETDEFDCVVSIDVLEHLDNDQLFLNELRRVLRPNGQAVVTVPNGDPRLLANRLKWQVGMTPEKYGHTRAGYTLAELSQSVEQAGFKPVNQGGYSRFFTEMMELIVNFGYVFVLSRKKGGAQPGHIAPATSNELKTHGAAYRLYSLAYPVMRLVSLLDNLLPASSNNAVIVIATKPEQSRHERH